MIRSTEIGVYRPLQEADLIKDRITQTILSNVDILGGIPLRKFIPQEGSDLIGLELSGVEIAGFLAKNEISLIPSNEAITGAIQQALPHSAREPVQTEHTQLEVIDSKSRRSFLKIASACTQLQSERALAQRGLIKVANHPRSKPLKPSSWLPTKRATGILVARANNSRQKEVLVNIKTLLEDQKVIPSVIKFEPVKVEIGVEQAD